MSLSTTIPFASLWLIPRLPTFRKLHPEVEVFVSADTQIVDLERGEIDVAVRYAPEDRAPANATRLFGERVVPVVSPVLMRDRSRPLRKLADLSHHVLLHLEDRFRKVRLLYLRTKAFEVEIRLFRLRRYGVEPIDPCTDVGASSDKPIKRGVNLREVCGDRR